MLQVFIYEKCNYDTDTSEISASFAGVHRVLVDDEAGFEASAWVRMR